MQTLTYVFRDCKFQNFCPYCELFSQRFYFLLLLFTIMNEWMVILFRYDQKLAESQFSPK